MKTRFMTELGKQKKNTEQLGGSGGTLGSQLREGWVRKVKEITGRKKWR